MGIVAVCIMAFVGAYPMDLPPHKNIGDGDIYRKGKPLTATGTIIEITEKDEKDGSGISPFLYISIKETKNSKLLIFAGPSWFSKNCNLLKCGDQIAVTGSVVKKNNTKIVLAKLIKKDEINIYLRNYNGDPLWECTDGDSMKKPAGGGMGGGRREQGGKSGPGGPPH